MKVPDSHHQREMTTMADITNITRGVNSNASMDKVKRLWSPGSKKKINANKTFGVPLEELVRRAPHGYKVPFIVKRICSYIEANGFELEGIFRVNGNSRIVDKLHQNFDQHGDANLDEDGDVMAVAGVLKLFLRELPDSVIPEHMTKQFVDLQETYRNDTAECLKKLKTILTELPEEHYNLLKFISHFLAVVSCNQVVNKMSPMALAIVFGPNIFRCGQGMLGLRDQGTTNQIVHKFIDQYNVLFKEEDEESPQQYWERKKHKIAPPRPPPPKFQNEAVTRTVPSPRKSKVMPNYESSNYQDHEDVDHSESSVSSRGRNSSSLHSPQFSDDEIAGRASPFVLDSDSGFSVIESPVPSARTSEVVEKIIAQTVIEKLFGDDSFLLGASLDATLKEIPMPDTSPRQRENHINSDSSDHEMLPVKERVQKFESVQKPTATSRSKGQKPKPNPKPAGLQGIMTQGAVSQNDQEKSKQDDVTLNARTTEVIRESDSFEGSEFEKVRRNSDTLSSYKRPLGPPNRRSPSRKFRLGVGEEDEGEDEEDKPEADSITPLPLNGSQGHKKHDNNNTEEDINYNQSKTRIAFLDVHRISDTEHPTSSPEKSPTNSRKPFIPLLDLSTLHQHVESHDAIPARKGQSMSYQRMTEQEDVDEKEVMSPRSSKLKKSGHSTLDDEVTAKMKSLSRKIQGLKRKIKHFEEEFENQHGYKPSQAEKSARPEVKKYITELTKARKEIKKVKEEAEMESRSRHGSGASSTGERTDPPDLPPTMEQTLDIILKRLKERRNEAQRPEDIELMTRDQVQEEKLSVQKALLHFEEIHGRPKTKDEKSLMRPLYDRYRTIKRLIARQPLSPHAQELHTVPEEPEHGVENAESHKTRDPIHVHVPRAEMEDDSDERYGGTVDFTVTRDFNILHESDKLTKFERRHGHSPKVKKKFVLDEMEENNENRNSIESNLHELTPSQLHDELIKSRNQKKKLRKVLREFEEDFFAQNGSRYPAIFLHSNLRVWT
ncbi:hypothetical protein ACJMK2_033522 [Sinanodonta woodiana]|uniref:Rho-GAP domain-containing protein n=2 Tax=Sinanodonta woodiana TaxID=1069815 RepID=A0ABD3WNM5_SINWO